MRENANQNNSEYGQFLRSAIITALVTCTFVLSNIFLQPAFAQIVSQW